MEEASEGKGKKNKRKLNEDDLPNKLPKNVDVSQAYNYSQVYSDFRSFYAAHPVDKSSLKNHSLSNYRGPNVEFNLAFDKDGSYKYPELPQSKNKNGNLNKKSNTSYGETQAKSNKAVLRTAAGEVWEDATLLDWDPNDYRIFVGNLGLDVSDEKLKSAFQKYQSFQRARIIRDKRTSKSKGYGFVSFKSPTDCTNALKEMNDKYIGSRPVKLKKSNWKDRVIDKAGAKVIIKEGFLGIKQNDHVQK
jgi:RNA recognition motif-containing protein